MNQGNQFETCTVCEHGLSISKRYPGMLYCSNCEFITADIELPDMELEKIYGPDYFHNGEYGDYIAEKSALQLNFKRRLQLISTLPSVGSQSTIFEIGCAYGFFLEMLKTRFSTFAGIDIAEEAVKYANESLGVEAHHGDFLDFKPGFNPNIVCMWDVIEHLKNPREILEHASQISAPDGYILITTGDVRSFNARMRGPKWRLFHPPTHLHYFSKKSITKLLHSVGYGNVKISYPSVWRNLGTILQAVFGQILGIKSLADKMANAPGSKLPIPLNLFDIMLITAQKSTKVSVD